MEIFSYSSIIKSHHRSWCLSPPFLHPQTFSRCTAAFFCPRTTARWVPVPLRTQKERSFLTITTVCEILNISTILIGSMRGQHLVSRADEHLPTQFPFISQSLYRGYFERLFFCLIFSFVLFMHKVWGLLVQ